MEIRSGYNVGYTAGAKNVAQASKETMDTKSSKIETELPTPSAAALDQSDKSISSLEIKRAVKKANEANNSNFYTSVSTPMQGTKGTLINVKV